MNNNIFSKIKNSEFLTYAELLKLKVSLVLFFLLVFGALTIPVSIFENFSLQIIIFVPVAFILMYLLSVLFLILNKIRFSMHVSIYTFIGLTVYYVIGSSHLYGYLLVFVTLIIIIFYQDIYTYILYGTPLTIYGVYYIYINGDFLTNQAESTMGFSSYVYQGILIGFFVVFLLHFILSDSIYDKINNDYLKIQKINKKYRSYALRYINDIEERKQNEPLHMQQRVQKSVHELSNFLSSFLDSDSTNIDEMIEFYFFLHDQSINEILSHESINPLTIKYTKELEKYLIDENSELNEILFTFATQFYTGFENDDSYRYKYKLNTLFHIKTNKLIALALIYRYLRVENTQFDKWGRVEKAYTHDEVIQLFKSNAFRDIISYEDMTFFLQNQHLFEKYLG